MKKLLINSLKTAVLSLFTFVCPLILAAQPTSTNKLIDEVVYQIEVKELSYEDASIETTKYLAYGDHEFSRKVSLAVGFELGYLQSGVNSGSSAVSITEVWEYNSRLYVQGTLMRSDGSVNSPGSTSGPSFGSVARYLLTSIAPPSPRFGPDRFTAAADVIPGNYSTCDGKKWVGGFRILDGENAGLFIEDRYKDECFEGDVTFLPPGIRANSKRQVIAYLGENIDWFYHR